MIIAVAAILVGCKGKGTRVQISDFVDKFKVEKLFVVDSITVYRFYDQGNAIYFTNRKGRVNGWKIEDVNPHDFSNFVSKGIMYRAIKDKEILFFQKGASVFTCPLNWRKIEIRYVHQLQHLLFGLGINHEMEV